MDRRVRWTPLAVGDLEDIADYIAKASPRYSAAVVRKIVAEARSLKRFSMRGRIVPDLDDTSIRELILYSYRLIYRVSDRDVHILGIVHGARDFLSWWNSESRE